jgi:ABC-2 type transport system permease protein
MGVRVTALLLRYLYLYRRSIARAMEVCFWPVMDLLLWGFLTTYLQTVAVPKAVSFLVGAMILWDVLYRCQQAISLAVTEEIWTRNVLNVFVTPVRTSELLLATCLLGVIKAGLPAILLGTLAYLLYSFNVLGVGPALAPFLASLLLFGWAVGMVTAALIVRFGQAAEALVWGVPFLIQPLSAVFYPLEVLPGPVQQVARLLPSTYVFEGMRVALFTGVVDVKLLLLAFGLNLVYLAAAAAFFGWMLARVREKGYLGKLGLE